MEKGKWKREHEIATCHLLWQNMVHLKFCFQILGSSSEFEFQHKMVPHARVRRSIPHTRLLKSDPLVRTFNNCVT